MNKIKYFLPIVLLIFVNAFAQNQSDTVIHVFMPGIVSTGHNERDMAISPDGKDMFYTVQSPRLFFSMIVHRSVKNNKWEEAETAAFSGRYQDLEPAFSPDGKRLFFVSDRPLTIGGKPKDFDIWYMERKDAGWSDPINAGPNVNTANDEFYPSVTADGSIYFTGIRADTLGHEDIYKSSWVNGAFQQPVNIGPGVNSVNSEYNAFIDPKERYILFSVEGDIPNYMGRGDLCISYHNTDGSWTKAETLGSKINSDRLDYCPFVYHDVFYFTSERIDPVYKDGKQLSTQDVNSRLDGPGNGYGDIYYIPVSVILDKKKLKE